MEDIYKPIMKPIYAEKIELKPGDTFNIKIKFKVSVSKKIIFDKTQLNVYLIKKT